MTLDLRTKQLRGASRSQLTCSFCRRSPGVLAFAVQQLLRDFGGGRDASPVQQLVCEFLGGDLRALRPDVDIMRRGVCAVGAALLDLQVLSIREVPWAVFCDVKMKHQAASICDRLETTFPVAVAVAGMDAGTRNQPERLCEVPEDEWAFFVQAATITICGAEAGAVTEARRMLLTLRAAELVEHSVWLGPTFAGLLRKPRALSGAPVVRLDENSESPVAFPRMLWDVRRLAEGSCCVVVWLEQDGEAVVLGEFAHVEELSFHLSHHEALPVRDRALSAGGLSDADLWQELLQECLPSVNEDS